MMEKKVNWSEHVKSHLLGSLWWERNRATNFLWRKKEEGDLPPYLRCSKVEISLLMTLFLARESKEMIVSNLASLVDWAWSWLFALGRVQLLAPMQLLVVAVPSLIEVAIVETWMFLLEAIEVSSKMIKISFFEREWDKRQRCPTRRARICGTTKFLVRHKVKQVK